MPVATAAGYASSAGKRTASEVYESYFITYNLILLPSPWITPDGKQTVERPMYVDFIYCSIYPNNQTGSYHLIL